MTNNKRTPTLGERRRERPAEQRPDDLRVGQNIKAAREAAGMSQAALAEHMAEAGFSAWRQTTVSRTERGERQLVASEAVELERLFGGRQLWRGTETELVLSGVSHSRLSARVLEGVEARLDRLAAEAAELRELVRDLRQEIERGGDDG